jgi:hypothetical protein
LCSSSLPQRLAGQTRKWVLAGWDFSGLPGGVNNYGPSPFSPTTTGAGVEVVGLTRGSGVGTAGTAAPAAWGGTGWNGPTGLSDAVAANNFVTFSVTPTAGNFVSFTSIEQYSILRSPSGPAAGHWQYLVGSETAQNTFQDIGFTRVWDRGSNPQPKILLNTISALQNTTETVTFRVVNWDASDADGAWYFNNFQAGDDLIITGTVTAVPEPSSLVLAAVACAGGLVGHRWRRRKSRGCTA